MFSNGNSSLLSKRRCPRAEAWGKEVLTTRSSQRSRYWHLSILLRGRFSAVEKRRLLDETEKPGGSVSTGAALQLEPEHALRLAQGGGGRRGDETARGRAAGAGVRGEAAQGTDSR